MDETSAPSRAWPNPAGEVFQAFLIQGLTAFGGPVAHIGYFRREFVERRAWLSEDAFADLLAEFGHMFPVVAVDVRRRDDVLMMVELLLAQTEARETMELE